MRNGLWSIVVGGVVGVLLGAGPVGAQPFPGGLPACVRQLNTCNADLQTCQEDLGACQVFPGDGVDGPALSYTDNGDGTFTDNNTLFMWEKKDTSGGIHDVNNAYTWSNAFAVFLAALNSPPCFAGHCDWRLPNIKEFKSIVDYSKFNPAASVPGSASADLYWSSTTDAGNSSSAWFVSFFAGSVSFVDKDVSLGVRAMRGGR